MPLEALFEEIKWILALVIDEKDVICLFMGPGSQKDFLDFVWIDARWINFNDLWSLNEHPEVPLRRITFCKASMFYFHTFAFKLVRLT